MLRRRNVKRPRRRRLLWPLGLVIASAAAAALVVAAGLHEPIELPLRDALLRLASTRAEASVALWRSTRPRSPTTAHGRGTATCSPSSSGQRRRPGQAPSPSICCSSSLAQATRSLPAPWRTCRPYRGCPRPVQLAAASAAPARDQPARPCHLRTRPRRCRAKARSHQAGGRSRRPRLHPHGAGRGAAAWGRDTSQHRPESRPPRHAVARLPPPPRPDRRLFCGCRPPPRRLPQRLAARLADPCRPAGSVGRWRRCPPCCTAEAPHPPADRPDRPRAPRRGAARRRTNPADRRWPRRRAGPIDLGALVAERRALRQAGGEHALTVDAEPNLVVKGDADWLRGVIDNLLGNAVTYAPPGTSIHVRIEAVKGEAVLAIVDHGPGVPESKRPRILTRFVRGVASASTQGLGLGLAVVAEAVAWHRGIVDVEDTPGERGDVYRSVAPAHPERRLTWRASWSSTTTSPSAN